MGGEGKERRTNERRRDDSRTRAREGEKCKEGGEGEKMEGN